MSPEINQLVCESCGKQFRKKYVLEQHLHCVHNVARATFKCDYCEYATRFEHNLERHVALHFSAKDFMCEQCGKAFSTEANLADHISYMHTQVRHFYYL